MEIPPTIVAQVDQIYASGGDAFDKIVDEYREMCRDGKDAENRTILGACIAHMCNKTPMQAATLLAVAIHRNAQEKPVKE